ncbi:hypothetical protein Cgig2_006469 [Carnegiea gigantea]|uniref:Uncharacterized protein n=1 Tax=Carnegiea gigantea TaxID=171969 RepID=A0A9Q1Q5I0_9CARY|nr:hypothetical protein Cgig2_006469 [Carnegiea gigantea]
MTSAVIKDYSTMSSYPRVFGLYSQVDNRGELDSPISLEATCVDGVHSDGSSDLATMIELAKAAGLQLSLSKWEEGMHILRATVNFPGNPGWSLRMDPQGTKDMRYVDLVEQGDDMWSFQKTEEPSYATMAFPIKICNDSLHLVLLAYPSNIRAFQLSTRRSCQAPP